MPDEPGGNAPHVYLIFGYVLVIAGSSQPPSKAMAAWPLPSESPHQPSPRSLAVMPRPFLNRSRYDWTAAVVSGVFTMFWLPSSETIAPPLA